MTPARARIALVALVTAMAILSLPACRTGPSVDDRKPGVIAFETSRHIHAINADGSGEMRLAEVASSDVWWNPMWAWSPSGREIAFCVGSELQAVDAKNREIRTIHRFSDDLDVRAVIDWSVDDAILLHLRLRTQSRTYQHLLASVEGDTGELKMLALLEEPGRGSYRMSVSPDGKHIAVAHENGIRLFSVLTRQWTTLSERWLGEDYARPAWSPDGMQIAYGTRDKLVLASSDGSGETVLLEAIFARPQWFPDGKRIAYYSLSGGIGEYRNVSVVNVDGTANKTVFQLDVRSGASIGGFGLSSDGRHIVLSTGTELVVLGVESNSRTTLLQGQLSSAHPKWAPR